MFQVKHDSMQMTVPIDTTGFNPFDPIANSKLPYVRGLVRGRIVELDSNGNVQLADGGVLGNKPLGLLLNNAYGEAYMNMASMSAFTEETPVIGVIHGASRIVTDQIDTALTFTPQDALYAGTGAKEGLISNVAAGATTATFAALLGLTVTPIAGTTGNFTLILVGGGTAGSESVDVTGDAELTLTIEDGVTTQAQAETELITHPWIVSVADASPATPITLDGDPANNEVTGSGGGDSSVQIGIAMSSASSSDPDLDMLML